MNAYPWPEWALGAGLAWLAWCALNVVVLLAVPLWHRPARNAYTNGLVIYVGRDLDALLSPRELDAIVAHELGHVAHGHNWRNLARRCVFLPSSEARDLALEHEADDYAAARGHGPALASALRKLQPFGGRDRARARRLVGPEGQSRMNVTA